MANNNGDKSRDHKSSTDKTDDQGKKVYGDPVYEAKDDIYSNAERVDMDESDVNLDKANLAGVQGKRKEDPAASELDSDSSEPTPVA